jgi:excisionase family DNA binding protein
MFPLFPKLSGNAALFFRGGSAMSTASREREKFFDNQDEWLTHTEAAKYLRVSEASLRNMVCYGRVTCYKLGNRNRYLKAELRNLLVKKTGGF